MSEVQGYCDAAFTRVRDLIAQNVYSQEELGLSLCVNISGKTVLDLWAGYADTARSKPWTENTITCPWSMSKCVTNLAALVLIDRGLLDPSAPVCKYWPEFAANGKENVLVWHVLTHSAALPAWDQPVTINDVYDTDTATERLAKQAPWWVPGSMSGYHPVTQGHLISELIRRVTGKRAREFINEEIAGPLGADLQLGVPESEWYRVAELVPPPPFVFPPGFDMTSLPARALSSPPLKAEFAATPEFRKTELPAINGFGNARSYARILSAISLGGTVDGTKLLRPETAQLASKELISGKDLVLGKPLRFSMGYGLPADPTKGWIREGSCYWGGWGGSMAIMDYSKQVTICYAQNRMATPGTTGDSRVEAYVNAIYEALEKYGNQGATASI
jgi:CubicO group peptidase (beta-lactamase class C family)